MCDLAIFDFETLAACPLITKRMIFNDRLRYKFFLTLSNRRLASLPHRVQSTLLQIFLDNAEVIRCAECKKCLLEYISSAQQPEHLRLVQCIFDIWLTTSTSRQIDSEAIVAALCDIERIIYTPARKTELEAYMLQNFGFSPLPDATNEPQKRSLSIDTEDVKRARVEDAESKSSHETIHHAESTANLCTSNDTDSANTHPALYTQLTDECASLLRSVAAKPKLNMKHVVGMILRPLDNSTRIVIYSNLKLWTLSDEMIYDLTTLVFAEARPQHVVAEYFTAVVLTKCRLLTTQVSRMLFKTIELCAKQTTLFIECIASRLLLHPGTETAFVVKGEIANLLVRITRMTTMKPYLNNILTQLLLPKTREATVVSLEQCCYQRAVKKSGSDGNVSVTTIAWNEVCLNAFLTLLQISGCKLTNEAAGALVSQLNEKCEKDDDFVCSPSFAPLLNVLVTLCRENIVPYLEDIKKLLTKNNSLAAKNALEKLDRE